MDTSDIHFYIKRIYDVIKIQSFNSFEGNNYHRYIGIRLFPIKQCSITYMHYYNDGGQFDDVYIQWDYVISIDAIKRYYRIEELLLG